MDGFKVRLSQIRGEAEACKAISKELKTLRDNLDGVRRNLSFEIAQKERIRNRMAQQSKELEEQQELTEQIYLSLTKIADLYEKAELTLCNLEYRDGLQSDDGNTESTSDLEDALDSLEKLSTSPSLAVAIKALIKEVVSLGKTLLGKKGKLKDLKLENVKYGKSDLISSVGDLIITVATDVVNALDHGSTTNALIADIIVDIGLWGVGEGAKIAGGAIGTAIGGVVGYTIGKYVGGMLGRGASVLMNMDWNGDEEGGVGKDALTDWLDNQVLDKFIDDHEIPAIL